MTDKASHCIAIRGARQHNLKNLDVDIPLGELVVVTGVSGSGKSSLVFDTLYAEGQRRYVETFSPYARQFLDRMDKPQVDAIEGILPAIAIDQVNPVRTSRSTVGTMTEINDHLKLLYARAATLYCRQCGQRVQRDDAHSIAATLRTRAAAGGDPRLQICFTVNVPKGLTVAQMKAELERSGYTRLLRESSGELVVIQDRLRVGNAESGRLSEALEGALRAGRGRLSIHALDDAGEERSVWRFSSDLHCADCDLHYQDASPGLFSFNSPVGACETCRGFGRVIGIDYGLVIPDESKSLAGGAIKPFQTGSYKECQDDLMRFAKKRGIPTDVPWRELMPEVRRWAIEGEGAWEKKVWYGAQRFFAWLETKAYKMHIRVLLSRYRSYTECPACKGARLKPDALLWRLGGDSQAPHGRNVHELALLPIDECRQVIDTLKLAGPLDEAADLVLAELRARLSYLCEVGLGYLTLDRQSRTLSGGEVQRINLTTALGTSLVNTLFVLDEPSIGLHPRDMGRVVRVMQKLRDAGNSLVVVEHDPQIMVEADRILDLGPGAGERGGRILCFDSPARVAAHPESLTGAWLSGRKQLPRLRAQEHAPTNAGEIRLEGVTAHNLKNVDVSIPLKRLVCITGVSGSGKSTLVQDVLYPALLKAHGRSTEAPLAHRRLIGAERVDDVVLIDQSPIGRTTRSNPASYVGAFDEVRALFAATDDARLRNYTAGTFSTNSGTGRCPVCGGNGFEHVEMQFLSDVYLRCGECNGRRYRNETLQVKLRGATGARASIADVLEMTVSEALAFFADQPAVLGRLQPLSDVGLDYVKLGQPVPTLSGGEAQRLKLAGHLAEAQLQKRASARRSKQAANGKGTPAEAPAQGKLLMFDEPTTGLHFEDIARLIRAFGLLLEAGHSLLVIEHNLDVIGAADWLIDLGPEGGTAGGEVVFTGTPAAILKHRDSHTGRALTEHAGSAEKLLSGVREPAAKRAASARTAAAPRDHQITVRGAREHNLKNIDVDIPRDGFTVVTGVSGSGKSTLAFDILFNEGQRRYLESLNAYARQFVQPAARADIDGLFGIPPTVAIEQRTSRGGLRSTVATLTEIYHFLRILYTRLGVQYCPDCDVPIAPQSAAAIAAQLQKSHRGAQLTLMAPLVAQRKGIYTDLARWAAARGVARLRVDGKFVPTDPFPRLKRFVEHSIEMPVHEVQVRSGSGAAGARATAELEQALSEALEAGRGVVHVLTPGGKVEVHSSQRACPSCGRGFPEPDPRLLSFNSPQGWCTDCHGTGLTLADFDSEQSSGEESGWQELRADAHTCSTCEGERLNPVARNLRFFGRSIGAATADPVSALREWLATLKLKAREQAIGRDALAEIEARLKFLERVGLGYLTLDRSAPTLSGGEAQRIRLAAQLGSNLQGVCYVLDEPTIGLHPRDNRLLLDALDQLARQRNTLVVVEHDEDTIRRADHVLDLGPGAGVRGGRVVAAGTAAQLMKNPASLTGRMLAHPLRHPLKPRRPVKTSDPALLLEGVNLHNLRDQDLRIPLGRLVVITGVSGSGKSTLARDVLHTNLHALLATQGKKKGAALRGVKKISGYEQIGRVLEVDQTPIGRTPRSCPATYVGFWDDIRRIYAGTTEARLRGWSASRFSFNTAGGRCPQCEGQGVRTIEMNFLPDVKVLCDRCGGKRFDAETLQVQWRERSVADLLALNVEDAVEFFAAHPRIRHSLELLRDVGLGYLTLGQASPTLSGGEAQRIKLVTELARLNVKLGRAANLPTLYVLDEPTVGLHMADVARLTAVLHRLVDAGHSVVMVEHNLDVMAEADWIIDMGPEAGSGGGRVVASGSPAQIAARAARSHTGAALAEFLRERGDA
ncbi:MAG: excinuclease ABC subunit UvrA [Steroidobacteraceae bacterium]